MPETQLTYISRVREVLDESTSRFWQDSDLRRWINDAAADIARKAEMLQSLVDIPITAITPEYTLPVDALRVYRVEYTRLTDPQVYPLEFRPFNAMDSIWWTQKDITQHTPYYYTMWGFTPSITLRLFPVPSDNGSAKVFYYRLPAKLATSTTADQNTNVDLPNGWEDLIVHYVEYRALRKDGDSRWQEAKGLYDENLDNMITLTRFYSDQQNMIVPASGTGWVPSWLWAGDGYNTYGGW
jgi:hypothetical protein